MKPEDIEQTNDTMAEEFKTPYVQGRASNQLGQILYWFKQDWFRYNRIGFAAFLVLIATGFIAIIGPTIAPYSPTEIRYDALLHSPSSEFLLGTDNYGRDVLSRLIFGARISITVALLVVLVGDGLGFLIGLISGYRGGLFDLLVQRFMDAILAFPTLALGLAMVAVLGPSLVNVILAISVTEVPKMARVTRSIVLAIKTTDYIDAAQAIGCSPVRIALRHVAPQCLPVFIVVATLSIGHSIVMESSLSFLGVGVPPTTPSWGNMLGGFGLEFARTAPWMATAPGMAITIVVLAANVWGDALRDILDPKLRGQL